MGNVRFVRDSAGIAAMLKSGPVQNLLLEEAERRKEFCEGLSVSGRARYRATVAEGEGRAVALVGTERDIYSRASNAAHNSLEKALRKRW